MESLELNDFIYTTFYWWFIVVCLYTLYGCKNFYILFVIYFKENSRWVAHTHTCGFSLLLKIQIIKCNVKFTTFFFLVPASAPFFSCCFYGCKSEERMFVAEEGAKMCVCGSRTTMGMRERKREREVHKWYTHGAQLFERSAFCPRGF